MDRLLALIGLIGTAPVSLVAALGIKLSDPGPVLYRAARSGLGGVPFTMYKFRTMRVARPGRGRPDHGRRATPGCSRGDACFAGSRSTSSRSWSTW